MGMAILGVGRRREGGHDGGHGRPGGVRRDVGRRQVLADGASGVVERLEIDGAQARELQRLEHDGLERVEVPHVLRGRRDGEQHALRRLRARAVGPHRDAGRDHRVGDRLVPLVDDEPRDRGGGEDRSVRGKDERELPAGRASARERQPAVVCAVWQLDDVERRGGVRADRFGERERAGQPADVGPHVRRAPQPAQTASGLPPVSPFAAASAAVSSPASRTRTHGSARKPSPKTSASRAS